MALMVLKVILVLLVVGAIVVINAPSITALYYKLRFGAVVDALPRAPGFTATDRVLIVSPHPDDESLCCGGMMQQALAAGAEVFVVWLTSGDGFALDGVLTERTLKPRGSPMENLGERRIEEAKDAAKVLGVAGHRLFFLGYPDRGLEKLLHQHFALPYRSRYTGLDRVSYAGAVSPGAEYTGANLLGDLRLVFQQARPTVVLAPSPLDRHQDHRAAGNLTLRILGETDEVAKARWWIVHGGVQWPLPKRLQPRLPLYPPPAGRGLDWQRVATTPEQGEVKLTAIHAHKSQFPVLARFLEAFVRTNELVSTEPLPVLDEEDVRVPD